MTSKIALTLLLLLFLSVSASAEDNPIVAKVGDWSLTLADFNRIVSYYDAEKQKTMEQKPEYRVSLLRRIVQGITIAQVARKKGFDQIPDMKERLMLMTNDMLSVEYLKREVLAKITVTEGDARSYYEAHPGEFRTPEQVRVRQIFIKVAKGDPEEKKLEARQKAEMLLKRLKAGESFGDLAAEFSDDASSKTKGGDLGFLGKGKLGGALEQAAFSLKPGDTSDVIATPWGFHLIKVEERKEPVLEAFADAKDKALEKTISARKNGVLSAFLDEAAKDAGVMINVEPLTKPATEHPVAK